jgi:2-iminobutanoate/2-iminopropanoate deaminase
MRAAGRNPFPWAEDFGYSQAMLAEGRLVFTAGQGGFGPDGAVVEPESFEAQLRQAYANLSAVLEAQGASLDDVVKVTVYLLRPEDYDAFKRVRAEVFPTKPYPASTAILAGGFLFEGMLVELDAVAVVSA